MKKTVFLIGIFLSSLVFAQSSNNELVVKFLKVSKVKEQFKKSIDTSIEEFGKTNPKEKANFANSLHTTASWEILQTPLINFTQQNFTKKELTKIIQFYETTEGKSYANKLILLGEFLERLTTKNYKQTINKSQKSSNNELVIRYLEVTKVKELINKMLDTFIEEFGKINPKEKANFANSLHTTASWEILQIPLINFTQQNFTKKELMKIIQFHETPEGKSYANKSILLGDYLARLIMKNLKQEIQNLFFRSFSIFFDNLLD